MGQIRVLVITGYGTNSHNETAYTAKLAGADQVNIVHFSDIVTTKTLISDYQFLVFPGGFLDGDDLGAAHAAAQRWKYLHDGNGQLLLKKIESFVSNGGLVLGICNGFQLLVKLGLLPAVDGKYFEQQVSLTHNDSARYEDRWVHLKVNTKSPCVFTQGLSEKTLLTMPVRHGEGKLVIKNTQLLQHLVDEELVVFQYADPITEEPTQTYPYNPNGSPLAIAGLTNFSGRILGLMPHPEAFHHITNHPGWTRGEHHLLGTCLFENAIQFLRNNKYMH